MVGDIEDMVSRLKTALPTGWFSTQSPNLTALMTAIASSWSWFYGLITYTSSQTRLSTASDIFLDLCANDYLGNSFVRLPSESDTNFRQRIKSALLPRAATRAAIAGGLTVLVGSEPRIFEPARSMDTGSYGILAGGRTPTGMAYGICGGWGNLGLPFQFFVSVVRPPTPGLGLLSGYGVPAGGYGVGTISYVDLTELPGITTDHQIQSTLCGLIPVNSVAWLNIQ